jgi:predicted nuclease of predicted toxin-antitoxin system
MKFLLDQGLPRSAAELLRNRHIDAAHVGEVGLASGSDSEILLRGRLEGRVVVTLDADFHTLMALSAATGPSVIRIRKQGLTAAPLVDLILEVASLCPADLEKGALVSVRPDAIKVHNLPVVRDAEE